MSFTFLNQLPTPAQIKEEYPLSKELTELKAKRDAMISDVICGKMIDFSLLSDLVQPTTRIQSVTMSAV